MKQLIYPGAVFFACGALAITALAGSETYGGAEMKQVVPVPVPSLCDWTGVYFGVHAGGEFGHSETGVLDIIRFGYSESGFNGGGQLGYNLQWHWLVAGPEVDMGYMDLNGRGTGLDLPGLGGFRALLHGETTSSFYTTLRGRAGVAIGCWLVYTTGGAIGLDYTTRLHPGHAESTDFNWGWTLGGGIERKLGRRWSIKAEYLHLKLNEQRFSIFRGETEGHILRAGLNYKFW